MLIKKLLKKLEENRESKKWFIDRYLKGRSYFTIMNQINRNSQLQPYVKKAIEKYLNE